MKKRRKALGGSGSDKLITGFSISADRERNLRERRQAANRYEKTGFLRFFQTIDGDKNSRLDHVEGIYANKERDYF